MLPVDRQLKINDVLDRTIKKIEQTSRDTYFDDLQAKEEAKEAIEHASKVGAIANDLNSKVEAHTVHHHHHRHEAVRFPDGSVGVVRTETVTHGPTVVTAPTPVIVKGSITNPSAPTVIVKANTPPQTVNVVKQAPVVVYSAAQSGDKT